MASDDDRKAGMEWYDSAREFAQSLTGDLHVGAGIVAALSPMTSWPENVKKARLLVETGHTYGLTANTVKAQRILAGEDSEAVLSGPKVRAFFYNIAGIDTVESVTVDRHAADIACGRTMSDSERSAVIGTPKRYKAVAEMYMRAARILSREYGMHITASQVQAVTWTTWRRNHAQAYHGEAA